MHDSSLIADDCCISPHSMGVLSNRKISNTGMACYYYAFEVLVVHDTSAPVSGDGWLFPHTMGVLSKGRTEGGPLLYTKSAVAQGTLPTHI
jgi:hypothetical protein